MKSNETAEAKQPGILYMVGTPIGNLEDITLRALRILKEVNGVLCEDTRVTKKLLTHFDIPQKTMSFHEPREGHLGISLNQIAHGVGKKPTHLRRETVKGLGVLRTMESNQGLDLSGREVGSGHFGVLPFPVVVWTR
jgi:siroheme synthase